MGARRVAREADPHAPRQRRDRTLVRQVDAALEHLECERTIEGPGVEIEKAESRRERTGGRALACGRRPIDGDHEAHVVPLLRAALAPVALPLVVLPHARASTTIVAPSAASSSRNRGSEVAIEATSSNHSGSASRVASAANAIAMRWSPRVAIV